jgi:undecaprenyl diphosphate synthase
MPGLKDRIRLLVRSPRDEEPRLPEVASSVALIMDGNGRWARRRGLPVLAGHRAGARALRRTVEASIDLGVRSLSVYAFSTENWTRPPDEVRDLLDLLGETIHREFKDLAAQGVRVRFVGRRDRLSPELAAELKGLEDTTATNEALDLYVCFDYGGRDELVEAARRLVRDGVPADEIDEAALRARLYEPSLPDPDLVIRSSGEHRVSNFLLFQIAYAELVFSDALWPDFGRDELASALGEYARRRRRFGGR